MEGALPTANREPTTNRQGFLNRSPRIVIHAASDEEAAAVWEQAMTATLRDGLAHHRRGAIRRGGSPRYEVAFTGCVRRGFPFGPVVTVSEAR